MAREAADKQESKDFYNGNSISWSWGRGRGRGGRRRRRKRDWREGRRGEKMGSREINRPPCQPNFLERLTLDNNARCEII